jgi:hypothetical protein
MEYIGDDDIDSILDKINSSNKLIFKDPKRNTT